MRLAHLSDLHIEELAGARFAQFANKRITGLANLLTFRRNLFSADVLERLVEDLTTVGFDHAVVTGDVSNLALEGEFERVRATLSHLGGYDRLSLVPGNHDYYADDAVAGKWFERTFHRHLFTEFTDLDVALYPYCKILDDVCIVGLNSAVKTPPLFASGQVGPSQLARLRQLAERRRVQRGFKVALLHHPLHERGPSDEFFGALRDRDAVARTLVDVGVDLVLHGHDHRAHRGTIDPHGRRVPVIGCGTSTSLDPHPEGVARYNLYTIEGGRLERVETRIYDPASRRFRWKASDALFDAAG